MRRLFFGVMLVFAAMPLRAATGQSSGDQSPSFRNPRRADLLPERKVSAQRFQLPPTKRGPADPPAQPASDGANRQRPSREVVNRQGHDHHHGHDRHGDRGEWYGSAGFPWIYNALYVPVVYTYYPYPAFGYGPGLPQVAANVAPANMGAAPNPAPLPANRAGLDPQPKLRSSHPEQKARAGRFIGFGDDNFGEQRYLAAVARYKMAIGIAPDVAESYFRQAFAQVAMGQYENAAKSFRRGLAVRSNWTGSPFRLDQIYAGAPVAKTHHIESLAQAVEDNPFDADLLMVLGMELFFDGQHDRSSVFFDRAEQLGGNAGGLFDHFLSKADAGGGQQVGGKIVF